jgi:hypothetical protein
MMQNSLTGSADREPIRQASDFIPPNHVGEFVLPGSGRRVWWTGRVAIGLLHQPVRQWGAHPRSGLWVQDLLLPQSLA